MLYKNPKEEDIVQSLISGEASDELRALFGAEAIDDMKAALRESGAEVQQEFVSLGRERGEPVYILPGILGSELSFVQNGFKQEVWLNIAGIPGGIVSKLAYESDDSDQIEATGALASTYFWLKLRLKAAGYNTEYLPYDWRDPVARSGERMHAFLSQEHSSPVTLVCHSMGGLVARAIAALDPQRKVVGRVITLGTPNLGSYSPFSVIRGSNKMLGWLGWADLTQSGEDITKNIIRHWPGLVEMLPRPQDGEVNLFDRNDWPDGPLPPVKALLNKAFKSQASLPEPDDRFVQVIGFGHSTIQSIGVQGSNVTHVRSKAGDGTVPIAFAAFGQPNKTYFVEGEHGKLPATRSVIRGVLDVLATGTTNRWSLRPPEYNVLESIERPEEEDAEVPHNPAVALSDFVGIPGVPRGAGMMHGYPISVIEEASEVYEQHAAEREEAARAAEAGDILGSDTEERLKLYAKRMVDLSDQAARSGEAENRERHPNLSMALERMAQGGASDIDLATGEAPSIEDGMSGLQFEAVLRETEDFLSVFYLKRAHIAAKSIGRVRERDRDFGFGTGFMIAPGLFMTNNHVLRSSEEANMSVVEFDYELDASNRSMTPQEFRFRPRDCFITNSTLDFTVVAVEPTSRSGVSLESYLYLPLNGAEGKIRAFSPINIVQHPDGRKKEVVFRDSQLQSLPANPDAATHFNGSHHDSVLHHTGDTQGGSSGSPVFSDRWEVVGLHNSAIPKRDKNGFWMMNDGTAKPSFLVTRSDDVKWVANQAIRISRIVNNLRQSLAADLIPEPFRPHVERILKVGEVAHREGFLYRPFGRNLPAGLVTERETIDRSVDIIAVPPNVVTRDATNGASDVTIRIDVNVNADGTATTIRSGGDSVDFSKAFERRRKASDYVDRKGYDPGFLVEHVPLPRLSQDLRRKASTLKDGSGTELRYSNFSVVMNGTRKLAFFAIGNFDPNAPHKVSRDEDPWALDPRLDRGHQATNFYYKSNDLDRGHLFRRLDGAWGDTRDAALQADHDTYHWTNIAPQHEIFNQSRLRPTLDLWGQLENEVTRVAHKEDARTTIINGPVFDDRHDPIHRGISVPMKYWKVIAHDDGDAVRAYAFILEQDDLLQDIPLERRAFEDFDVNQMSVFTLGQQLGIDFGRLTEFDVLELVSVRETRRLNRGRIKIRNAADIVVR